MPGLFLIRQDFAIGHAIDELEITILCGYDNEWHNRIEHLPL